MATDDINLKLTIDNSASVNTLNALEKKLGDLKTAIKGVEVGSAEFKKFQSEILATDTKVKNLNKSFEGLDKEALAGEWGKLTGGITSAITGIAAMSGGASKSMEQVVKTVAQGMAVAQGFKGAAEAAASAQKLWNIAMTANPIGIIIAGVAAFIGVIVLLISKGDKIKEMLTSWGERFSFLKGPIEIIKKMITGLQDAWEWLKKAVMGEEAYEAQVAEKKEKREAEAEVTRLERLKKRREAEGATAAELLAIETQLLENKKKLAEKGSEEWEELEDERIKLQRDYTEKYNADEQKRIDEWKKKQEAKAKADADYKQMLYDQEVGFQQQLQDYLNELNEQEVELEDFDPSTDPEIQKHEAILARKAELDLIWSQTYMETLGLLTEEEQEEYDKQLEAYQFLLESKQISQQEFNALSLQLQNKYYGNLTKMQQNYVRWANMTDQERAEFVIDSLSSIFGAAKELFKEHTAAYKILASAQIVMDAASAVMKTWSAYSGIPVAGPILAGLQTAVIVATAATQLAKIAGVKFAKGGVLLGPSHAQGGILTPYGELEGGEGVINTSSMSIPSVRNLASAANVAGGGNDFSVGDGSVKLSTESISMIINGINNKKVYVVESDITETQRKVSVMESAALL